MDHCLEQDPDKARAVGGGGLKEGGKAENWNARYKEGTEKVAHVHMFTVVLVCISPVSVEFVCRLRGSLKLADAARYACIDKETKRRRLTRRECDIIRTEELHTPHPYTSRRIFRRALLHARPKPSKPFYLGRSCQVVYSEYLRTFYRKKSSQR